MLTEQEIQKYGLKDLQFREEMLAKNYAAFKNNITEPNLQQMMSKMEQSSRNRYKIISEKMNTLGIY